MDLSKGGLAQSPPVDTQTPVRFANRNLSSFMYRSIPRAGRRSFDRLHIESQSEVELSKDQESEVQSVPSKRRRFEFDSNYPTSNDDAKRMRDDHDFGQDPDEGHAQMLPPRGRCGGANPHSPLPLTVAASKHLQAAIKKLENDCFSATDPPVASSPIAMNEGSDDEDEEQDLSESVTTGRRWHSSKIEDESEDDESVHAEGQSSQLGPRLDLDLASCPF
ncbi:uncharacterized protein JCM15063_005485 [Sporobolomyces koalae]|uniref:uncharacterized protein n=1 Tax=Sporobolomyces koalae TaxID=500713 RepID=UPI00317AB76A